MDNKQVAENKASNIRKLLKELTYNVDYLASLGYEVDIKQHDRYVVSYPVKTALFEVEIVKKEKI